MKRDRKKLTWDIMKTKKKNAFLWSHVFSLCWLADNKKFLHRTSLNSIKTKHCWSSKKVRSKNWHLFCPERKKNVVLFFQSHPWNWNKRNIRNVFRCNFKPLSDQSIEMTMNHHFASHLFWPHLIHWPNLVSWPDLCWPNLTRDWNLWQCPLIHFVRFFMSFLTSAKCLQWAGKKHVSLWLSLWKSGQTSHTHTHFFSNSSQLSSECEICPDQLEECERVKRLLLCIFDNCSCELWNPIFLFALKK